MRPLLPLTLALLLAGCGTVRQSAGMLPQWSNDWRQVATDNDRNRLRNWRKAFVDGLDAARKAGHAAEITREGALLDPDAAQAGGAIPSGSYACRVIKLGAKSAGMLDYVSYPPFICRIDQERDLQGFAKLTGSQRPVACAGPLRR